jgi:DNA-damage-inducible protein J
MNMMTAFTIFVRQSLRQRAIPFGITTQSDPFYNEHNQQLLLQAINDLKNGKGVEHNLIEA